MKAWQVGSILFSEKPDPDLLEAGAKVEIKRIGNSTASPVEEVAVTPWADHLKVRAALAAADRSLEALREIISREAWEAANCAKVQREIREVTK